MRQNLLICLTAAAFIASAGATSLASPPACERSPLDMVKQSDVIVLAVPDGAATKTVKGDWLSWRATYKVTDTIAGKPGKTVTLERRCDMRPYDSNRMGSMPPGYPNSRCGKSTGAHLPGFAVDGKLAKKRPAAELLYLHAAGPSAVDKKPVRPRVKSYSHSGCDMTTDWHRDQAADIKQLRALVKNPTKRGTTKPNVFDE